jgi:hypothetical protein
MSTITAAPPEMVKKAPTVVIEPMERDIQHQIRERAYQLFEERGRENGHDLEDWLQAEIEMLSERQPIAA